tara:strand:- start:750 stop:899 length:150 start_codon:yes stop_codon:yes gene_type:complete
LSCRVEFAWLAGSLVHELDNYLLFVLFEKLEQRHGRDGMETRRTPPSQF